MRPFGECTAGCSLDSRQTVRMNLRPEDFGYRRLLTLPEYL
jgi:hypothetical protein